MVNNSAVDGMPAKRRCYHLWLVFTRNEAAFTKQIKDLAVYLLPCERPEHAPEFDQAVWLQVIR
jgi:hypothetical protein